jgi:hypothetical protein
MRLPVQAAAVKRGSNHGVSPARGGVRPSQVLGPTKVMYPCVCAGGCSATSSTTCEGNVGCYCNSSGNCVCNSK